MTGGLRSRPTGEVAVLILTSLVAIILLVLTLGIVIAAFLQPERPTVAAIGQIMDVLTVILGAVVGYIAGRGTKASVTKTHGGTDVWDPTEPPQPPAPPAAGPVL